MVGIDIEHGEVAAGAGGDADQLAWPVRPQMREPVGIGGGVMESVRAGGSFVAAAREHCVGGIAREIDRHAADIIDIGRVSGHDAHCSLLSRQGRVLVLPTGSAIEG